MRNIARKSRLLGSTMIILAVAAFLFATGAAPGPTPAPKKKALFVWGGWEGHEPKQCVDIFAPWLREQGFEVEISHTLDSYLDVEKWKSLDLIVHVFTMSEIKPEQEKGLEEAVKSGVGVARLAG